MKKISPYIFILLFLIKSQAKAQQEFVRQKTGQFVLDGKPYYYIGANY